MAAWHRQAGDAEAQVEQVAATFDDPALAEALRRVALKRLSTGWQ